MSGGGERSPEIAQVETPPEGAVYLPDTDADNGPLDGWWMPLETMPGWWVMVAPCYDTCHHPIHAFNPERRPHIIPASEVTGA